MTSPFAAFKALLVTTPKVDTKDDFAAEDVYQYYLAREQRSDVEAFFGMSIELLITKLVDRQVTYDSYYSQYKEIAKHLQKVYEQRTK